MIGQNRGDDKKQKKDTFTPVNEGGTKLEGKGVGSINGEKHDSEGTTLPYSRLEVYYPGAQGVLVIKRVEGILRAKSMTGSDGRDDLLGERTTLADMLERFLHVFGDELVH